MKLAVTKKMKTIRKFYARNEIFQESLTFPQTTEEAREKNKEQMNKKQTVLCTFFYLLIGIYKNTSCGMIIP